MGVLVRAGGVMRRLRRWCPSQVRTGGLWDARRGGYGSVLVLFKTKVVGGAVEG